MQANERENLKTNRYFIPGTLKIVRLASVRCLCLATLLISSTWPTAAQTQTTNTQQEIATTRGQVFRLSPEAAQVADEIGVTPLLKRLERVSGGAPADGSQVTLESLAVRQEITEKVLAASLDVDSVNAVIDAEIEQIRGIRAELQTKRDKAQNIINIASILTGGVAGAITSAMQFKPSTVNLGNGIGVAGGTGSVVLDRRNAYAGRAKIARRLAADARQILWPAARCDGSNSQCLS